MVAKRKVRLLIFQSPADPVFEPVYLDESCWALTGRNEVVEPNLHMSQMLLNVCLIQDLIIFQNVSKDPVLN